MWDRGGQTIVYIEEEIRKGKSAGILLLFFAAARLNRARVSSQGYAILGVCHFGTHQEWRKRGI